MARRPGDLMIVGTGLRHCPPSPWATEVRVALGQRTVANHKNEISGHTDLLAQVIAQGAIITMNAMGCQWDLAWPMFAAEAHYVLTFKKNQPETFVAVTEGTLKVALGDRA